MKAEITKAIQDNTIPTDFGGRDCLIMSEAQLGHLVKDLMKLFNELSKPEKDFIVEGMIDQVFVEMNEAWGSDYKSTTEGNRKPIRGRISEGHTLEEIILVVKTVGRQWANDTHMQKYLRPITVFSASKFDGYLNQALRLKSTADNMVYVVDSYGHRRRITKTQFETAEDGFFKRLD